MIIPRTIRERSIFVDTSAFYALLDRSDQWHSEALQGFERLAQERRSLFTSNLIIAETYILARYALGYGIAVRWLESLDLNLVFQTDTDHEQVRTVLAQYEDKDFSYTDVASFVVMERLGVPTAFTFDAHFLQYGLEVLP